MESTLDIRVKQRRLFCAQSVIIIWKLLLALHRTQPSRAKLVPAPPGGREKTLFNVFYYICFCSELIPEISKNNFWIKYNMRVEYKLKSATLRVFTKIYSHDPLISKIFP